MSRGAGEGAPRGRAGTRGERDRVGGRGGAADPPWSRDRPGWRMTSSQALAACRSSGPGSEGREGGVREGVVESALVERAGEGGSGEAGKWW